MLSTQKETGNFITMVSSQQSELGGGAFDIMVNAIGERLRDLNSNPCLIAFN